MTDQLPILPTVGDTIPEIVRFLTMTKSVSSAISDAEKPARERLRELVEKTEQSLGVDAFTAKTPYGTAAITNPEEKLVVTNPEAFYKWCLAGPGRLGPWFPEAVEKVRINPSVDDHELVHCVEAMNGDGCDENPNNEKCPLGIEDHDVFLRGALEITTGYLMPSESDVNLLTQHDGFIFGEVGHPCRWIDKDGVVDDIDGTNTKQAARQLRVVISKDAQKEMLDTLMIRTKEIE